MFDLIAERVERPFRKPAMVPRILSTTLHVVIIAVVIAIPLLTVTNSLHMQGRAIDIRLADVPLATLRSAAILAGRGGVGYYPASDFVHVDTGRVRTW